MIIPSKLLIMLQELLLCALNYIVIDLFGHEQLLFVLGLA